MWYWRRKRANIPAENISREIYPLYIYYMYLKDIPSPTYVQYIYATNIRLRGRIFGPWDTSPSKKMLVSVKLSETANCLPTKSPTEKNPRAICPRYIGHQFMSRYIRSNISRDISSANIHYPGDRSREMRWYCQIAGGSTTAAIDGWRFRSR